MPAITGTTTGGVAASVRTTYTTPLLAQIQPGSTIQASHINSIVDFVNVIAFHTHSALEYTTIYNTGNINGGTVATNRTTSGGGTTLIGAYIATTGATITATHHNTLGAAVNSTRVHSHTFLDDVP